MCFVPGTAIDTRCKFAASSDLWIDPRILAGLFFWGGENSGGKLSFGLPFKTTNKGGYQHGVPRDSEHVRRWTPSQLTFPCPKSLTFEQGKRALLGDLVNH